LANRSGTDVEERAVDYTNDEIDDNGLVHYYKDSYKINVNRCYVELGGI